MDDESFEEREDLEERNLESMDGIVVEGVFAERDEGNMVFGLSN
jgi:hypothetical protein